MGEIHPVVSKNGGGAPSHGRDGGCFRRVPHLPTRPAGLTPETEREPPMTLDTTLRKFLACLAALAIATTARAQLAGDECATAFNAVAGANGPVNLASLTASANPPANDDCSFLNWTATTRDAWWAFASPGAGLLTVEFCGSTFDTSVVVYEGSCAGLVRIGCDDDSCAPNGPTYQSKIVDLPVHAGTVYIRVGGYLGATGTVNFNLAYKPTFATKWGGNVIAVNDIPSDVQAARAIYAGADHSAVIRTDGTMSCWGFNGYGQRDVPATLGQVTMAALGADHSVALKTTTQVVCWGHNQMGQCNVPAAAANARFVGAGFDFSMAITLTGGVVCWGDNSRGQCSVPASVGSALAVDGGNLHSVALKVGNTVACWGDNAFGQCNVPATLGTVRSVQAGAAHTVALKSNGTVACWGSNGNGQCNVPATLTNVRDIAAGYYFTVAITKDGSLVCWGDGSGGLTTPPAVSSPAHSVAAGWSHVLSMSAYDCDGNGAVDPFEIGLHDCNNNGIHDCWDFQTGQAEDCNHNLIADQCEKQMMLTIFSPHLGPIGLHQERSWSIPNAALAVDAVTLRVRGHGDFSGALEHLNLSWNTLPPTPALAGTGDCVAVPAFETLTLTPEEFNSGIGTDGVWRLNIGTTSAVDPLLCPDGTWVELKLEYLAATSADCDGNGVLDSCQIAAGDAPDANHNGIIDSCEAPLTVCPGDVNGDHVVGAQDLALLLGAWGSTNASADIDGNGVVGAPDLALLLGAWGACPSS